MRSGTSLQTYQGSLHVRGVSQELLPCELPPHKHLAGCAKRHEMKRCLAQVDANRMYLHVDDPPFLKLPPRSTCFRRWSKRRTISLADFPFLFVCLGATTR